VFSSPHVDTSTDLSTADALAVVDQIAAMNVSGAILTGGEVLARGDALQIIEALGDRGVLVCLETNGVLVTPRFARLARELQAKGLFSMSVSLDGGTAAAHEAIRGRGSFDATLRGLRLLKAHGVRYSVQMVLTRRNAATIPDIYALARECYPEWQRQQFSLLTPVGRGTSLMADSGLRAADVRAICAAIKREECSFPGQTLIKAPPAMIPPQHLDLLFKRERVHSQVSCSFPLLGVLPDGHVTVCAMSRDQADLSFGDVRRTSLKEIWLNTRMAMLRSEYLAAEHLTGICADCVWKYSCRGGCRAWAYEDGGSFAAPLPLCSAMEAAGEFPRAYRISAQSKAVAQWAAQAAGGGCTTCSSL
jgi:radical SAM protein with 4Fe4S-binding SPASM domain